MRTFTDFAEAQAAATQSETPTQVCGTYVGEQPHYFLMDADAPDDDIRDASFEVKNSRPPNAYERWLLDQVQKSIEANPA